MPGGSAALGRQRHGHRGAPITRRPHVETSQRELAPLTSLLHTVAIVQDASNTTRCVERASGLAERQRWTARWDPLSEQLSPTQ
ncbi:unnamed protein product [Lampetra planeri]